jgi:hypothetical protein
MLPARRCAAGLETNVMLSGVGLNVRLLTSMRFWIWVEFAARMQVRLLL